MSDKNFSLEAEAKIVIDIVSDRIGAHGNFSARPIDYLGAGLILKSDRVRKTAINIVAQAAHPPKESFLSAEDRDTLRDMVAYCLETLRKDSELAYEAEKAGLPF